jgi:ribosomal protein L9
MKDEDKAKEQLIKELRQRTAELEKSDRLRKLAEALNEALNDICLTVNSTLDFDEMMQRVVIETAKATGSETAAISLS